MTSSVQPRKQRNARRDATMQERKKLMHSRIAPALRQKLGTRMRSILVRKGDKVKVTSGSYKKKEGTVLEASYSALKLFIEGVTRKNSRGQEKLVKVDPSNVQIIDGDFSLKNRKAILERSAKAAPGPVPEHKK